jgi:hypothetical protein
MKLKILFYKLIKRILLGKILGAYPTNLVRSVQELIEMDKRTIGNIKPVAKPYIQEYGFPDTYPKYFRRNKSFEEKNIITFNNVILEPNSGLLISPNSNSIYLESIGSVYRYLGWGNILSRNLKIEKKIEFEEFVFPFPDTGYYHWLFEVLPNFFICLNEKPGLKVVVTQRSSIYIKDLLEYVFGEDLNNRVITVSGKKSLNINKVIIAQYSSYSGFIHKFDIELLKKNLPCNSNKGKERIYISRSKTEKRPIANEVKLEEILRIYGFEIMFLEDLGFIDQVNYLSNAEVVFGPHGAGLSNIVFSKKLKKVIEIFQVEIYNDCYGRLAKQLDAEYQYFRCSSKDGKILAPIIEIEKLAQAL